jgi:3-deoxy-7-phosphoheptulonate synthase
VKRKGFTFHVLRLKECAMIIIMQMGATPDQIEHVIQCVEDGGYQAHPVYGVERTIIGVIGDGRPVEPGPYELLTGVERVVRVLHPFKLASRDFHPQDTIIPLNGLSVGAGRLVVMAGPCSVENRDQILATARAVQQAGATVLRGGAFKPRTSPYSFRGLGREGLDLLAEARRETGLPIVTEVLSIRDVDLVAGYADILQIGARNMQNYALLEAVGDTGRPVLLKRGMSSTLEELLMASDYILSHGNSQVMLCERGIRTFEKYTRNTFDVNAIPALKKLSHLPVIADPSHGVGLWDLVPAVAMAAVAAGADGLLIEVHPQPEKALSDGVQSLRPDNFARLMDSLRQLAPLMGRQL